jgi:hypothetical protein
MSNSIVIDLFVEDHAHEEFLKAVLYRLAREEGKSILVRVRSARGGHGRVLTEFALYQKSVLKAPGDMTIPDLLVIAIDANCKRFNNARKDIEATIEPPFRTRAIVACPDPHVERWYLADPTSFAEAVGIRPKVGRKKCERDHYKMILSRAVVEAGHPPTLGGIEFAREIVDVMHLYHAGRAEASLKHFLDETTARFRLF